MNGRLRWWTLVAVLAGCGGGGGGLTSDPVADSPQPAPPPVAAVELEPAFPGLSFARPLALIPAPSGAAGWYVVEQGGIVRRFADDPQVVSSEVFADLTPIVDASYGESGLFGMAFDPDFADNGFVYLSFTVSGAPLESRVDRFTSRDGGQTLDLATRRQVLSVPQPETNHNGGQILFGRDGLLYVGFGDGGGSGDPGNNAQDTTNLLGTIIRIDVAGAQPYEIPPDNPFASNAPCPGGSGAAACPEIFAWGLRNPWRFTVDAQTGEVYAGDVGQGEYEEIDRIVNGGNFGWNIREAAHCYRAASCTTAGLIDPIHEYAHDIGSSVTGGYVYRGQAIPALIGRYVFGDFVSGRIWSLDAAAQSLTPAEELLDTDLNIASFAEGPAGELYVVALGGELYRLVAR
jgi:glucose/arabinose dehydrogenase